jgi:polyisoprenoid-binding protein YceI
MCVETYSVITNKESNVKTIQLTAALLLAASGATFAQTTYEIDTAHSSAQFSVRHMMVSNVKGEFNKVTGSVVYDAKNLAASKINAVVDVSTISTREPKRDAHLKSADFFDVAKYATIEFHSKSVTTSGGKIQARGDLSMHGVTKEVVLTVEPLSTEIKDPYGMLRTGTTASTKVNRRDWGLSWNGALEAGGVVVGDEVTITLDIELTRKPK